MGDLGYLDRQGRVWFCGRKSQRVISSGETLYTVPCEEVFNAHPAVFRTALVGVGTWPMQRPVLCVELADRRRWRGSERLRKELLELALNHRGTRKIQTVLFHRGFPVDIRHNSKIFREKLAVWANRKLRRSKPDS
jgi:acyl-coenzyme A synthetase/AMP-(fatty) acid ligase